MNTRLRYSKVNGLLVSGSELTHKGNVYAELNEVTKEYKIKVTETGEVLASGKGTSLHELKKKSKKEIRLMGAAFGSEVRLKETL